MLKTFAVCVASLLAITLVPQSASAGSGDFRDATGDVTGVARADVTSVTVQNYRKKLVLHVRNRFPNTDGMSIDGPQSWWSIFLETDWRKRGPEWRVYFGYETYPQVAPVVKRKTKWVAKWSPDYPRLGRCARGVKSKVIGSHPRITVRITIPKKRGCFTARGLRVHARVHSSLDQFSGSRASVTDELPNGARTNSRLVSVGKSFTVKDRRDRVNWWNDIRTVLVDHTDTRLGVFVSHLKKRDFSGSVTTYIDDDADDVPDWAVWVADAGGGRQLVRMHDWVVDEDNWRDCDFEGAIAHDSSMSYFSVRTSCLGDPRSVRIAVKTEQFADGQHHAQDWLGGVRRWSAPIAVG